MIKRSKKLTGIEYQGLLGTPTYESMLQNKLEVFQSTKDDETLWDLLDHFDVNASGVFHMTTIGNDNIWRIYFENTGDCNAFVQLFQATGKETEVTPNIESIVVNTTHDTE
mgnify:FL=1|jgi:hypothetical protein